MRIQHVGLVCRSEGNSDRFYQDLLGLEKTRSFTLSRELARDLFGFDQSFQVITYLKDDAHFEIFVIEESKAAPPQFHHVALEVENRERFLEECRGMLVPVVDVSKEGKVVTMIRDFDGNLFEIKDKA